MSWYFQPCQPEHQFFSELDLTTGNGTKITLQFYATQTTCTIFWGNIWILRFFFTRYAKWLLSAKKGTRKIANDIIFRIRFDFSRKNYIEYFLVCYTFCFIQTHVIETNEDSSSESLQSLLMKPLMTISISVYSQIVLLHVTLNFFLNNFLNFFVRFYNTLQESFHSGNCWLL